MPKLITQEIFNEMVRMRKEGKTHAEIMAELGVSKWACTNHLKGIEPVQSWTKKVWRAAEEEARKVLIEMGFTHIIDLNAVCNVAPFWDYAAELGEEKWLIDVTTNQYKSLAEKQSKGVEGFSLGILYKDHEWRLIKIASEVVFRKGIEIGNDPRK